MNFKEQLVLDHAVFLNLNEFAELISIEGIPDPIPAVCDWAAEPDGEHLYAATESWGVNRVHATVILRESALPEMSPGCELTITDRPRQCSGRQCRWTVRSASSAGGLLTLNLYRNVA